MPCTLRRPERFRAHHDERLGPGRSAAPDDDRLVLLPSGPDTVRGSPLRGTRSSTSHRRAAFENGDLGRGFSPAIADCRYRAPLVPRLARPRKFTSARLASTGSGGEGGIRTRDGLPRTAFPVRRHSPLGDLSGSRTRRLTFVDMAVLARRSAEHRSERTRRCVSEERRRQRGQGRQIDERGGEGGIRTRGAFAHRFSRAAPSTTRTPLRGRGYQTRPADPCPDEPAAARRQRTASSGRTGPRPRRGGCR